MVCGIRGLWKTGFSAAYVRNRIARRRRFLIAINHSLRECYCSLLFLHQLPGAAIRSPLQIAVFPAQLADRRSPLHDLVRRNEEPTAGVLGSCERPLKGRKRGEEGATSSFRQGMVGGPEERLHLGGRTRLRGFGGGPAHRSRLSKGPRLVRQLRDVVVASPMDVGTTGR
jgi:hypothetical protein